MNTILIEINKIFQRRYSFYLLCGTLLVFPLFIIIVSYLNIEKDNVPEGLFVDNVCFGIIATSQTYLFLPIWVIVIVGQELSNGYVNRVAFERSKKFFFYSKLLYVGIISILFTALGIVAHYVAVELSPYKSVDTSFAHYFHFSTQLIFSTFIYSLFLLNITFMFGTAIKAFLFYFFWTFIEGLLFSVLEGVYKMKADWLPIHLIRKTYLFNGEAQSSNYYNPFIDFDYAVVVMPIGFLIGITLITYFKFIKSDLPTLSD